MEKPRFDPFADREARLLRNELAGSLVAALRAGDPSLFLDKGRELLGRTANPVHRAYLQDRLRRYEAAWNSTRDRAPRNPFAQALLLWNHGLFYEVHEILESLWRQGQGDRRRALQAMIQAAGVYVHLEAGHREAAQSMAAKAAAGLRADRGALPPFHGFEELLAALADLDRTAPCLDPAPVQND